MAVYSVILSKILAYEEQICFFLLVSLLYAQLDKRKYGRLHLQSKWAGRGHWCSVDFYLGLISAAAARRVEEVDRKTATAKPA